MNTVVVATVGFHGCWLEWTEVGRQCGRPVWEGREEREHEHEHNNIELELELKLEPEQNIPLQTHLSSLHLSYLALIIIIVTDIT